MKFYKEQDNRWYAYIPTFEGDKSELEMVLGADTLLDMLCDNNSSEVDLEISLTEMEDCFELNLVRLGGTEGGGYYYSEDFKIELWLCPVVEFVFNHIPTQIYFNKI